MHQGMVNSSSNNNKTNILDLSQQIQRIQRNVRGHLRPTLSRLVDDDTSQTNTGQFIPIMSDDHWICNVRRHGELEQIIADLEAKIDEQQKELANIRHENRRLERSLIKKSIKIDALDLAASRKQSRSTVDLNEMENLQVIHFRKKNVNYE